jgi:hypothetical protein
VHQTHRQLTECFTLPRTWNNGAWIFHHVIGHPWTRRHFDMYRQSLWWRLNTVIVLRNTDQTPTTAHSQSHRHKLTQNARTQNARTQTHANARIHKYPHVHTYTHTHWHTNSRARAHTHRLTHKHTHTHTHAREHTHTDFLSNGHNFLKCFVKLRWHTFLKGIENLVHPFDLRFKINTTAPVSCTWVPTIQNTKVHFSEQDQNKYCSAWNITPTPNLVQIFLHLSLNCKYGSVNIY